jgi:hypothetical protein
MKYYPLALSITISCIFIIIGFNLAISYYRVDTAKHYCERLDKENNQ